MKSRVALFTLVAIIVAFSGVSAPAQDAEPGHPNLVHNSNFQSLTTDSHHPADYELKGDVEYRYLGDPARDASGWGVALQSAKDLNNDGKIQGSVSQTVTGIDSSAGRWFEFSFRGLPQDNFAVDSDGLYMSVEYFGDGGHTSLDGKVKRIYPQIQQDRRDLSVNGDHRVGGAAVWRRYDLKFYLPFPQVDQMRLTVGFDHGAATRPLAAEFFVTDFSLRRIEEADASTEAVATVVVEQPKGKLLPIGGRWYYAPTNDQDHPPKIFDHNNADRLVYHDDKWTAPFAGAMTSWLRAGDKDLDGNVVDKDRLVPDNVTVSFDATSMIIHTKGLPNHPTGKFPEAGFGPGNNPNFIQEQQNTYYIPLNPKENPRHLATTTNNSNHALPMGPIGIAANGVVFFNPFDMGNQDASNMMDRCCGHPNQDNLYHYHKYPICLNSPWADEGKEHSPVIGWAFDGFPIYGPYESPGVMAKDVKGDGALNEFNIQWDKDRGWHYHVTPGKFPYIIGGYWGTEDPRDRQRPRHPNGGQGGPGGPGGGFGGGFGGGPGNGGPPGPFQADSAAPRAGMARLRATDETDN